MANEVPKEKECSFCHGRGKRGGETCSKCGGTGKESVTHYPPGTNPYKKKD